MNNIICGWNIANSIIKKSFEERIYITPLKLNCLVYLLYSNYLFKTGEKLFNEPFIKNKNGPIVPTIDYKFSCFENNIITKYAKDACGKIIFINFNCLEKILLDIWNSYKNMSDIELLTFINETSSIFKKENNEIIYDIEILDDETKRNQVSLEYAKDIRKKLLSK